MGKLNLLMPDPYYTPGYSGYCPRFKYEIGKTYGASTHNILKDENANRSKRTVLAVTLPDGDLTRTSKGWITAHEMNTKKVVENRQQSHGNQKYVYRMTPGYTGFVPRSQNQFGLRFANSCNDAIAEFDHEQDKMLKNNYLLSTVKQKTFPKIQFDSKTEKEIQTAIEDVSIKLTSKSALKTIPITYMNDDDSDKFQKSGYTGYVPRRKELIGLSYPVSSHVAMKQSHNEQRARSATAHKPIVINRPFKSARDSRVIYPNASGIIPHYTGHVPGLKYRIGGTYGNTTINALQVK